MKKKNIALLITLSLLFAFQAEAQISVGGGLGYNEKIAGPGITLKGAFDLTENIAVSPSASYFFGSSLFGFNRNLIAIDVNAHYYFDIIEEELKVYPVAGLNFSRYKTGLSDILGANTGNITANAFGVNIGAGATYKFTDRLKVYLEPKFIISNYSQIVINAGVLFNL